MPKRKSAPKLPKPRRARGTGSVLPDPRRGGWLGKVPVGKYPDGRTRYKEVRGATQAEVVAKMRLVAPPDPDTLTVAEWAERWFAGLSVRTSSKANYRRAKELIVGSLGSVRLVDVTVGQVSAALASWVTPKRGASTANLTLHIARVMSAVAVREGLLARDPFALCPLLKVERKPIDPFTPAELKAIVNAWQRHRSGPWFALAASTGLRMGELSALDVTDVDTAAWTVSVTKTYDVRYGVGPPKSRHGRRVVPVPEPARAAVLSAIAGRAAGVLFEPIKGGRLNGAYIYRRLAALCGQLGIRPRNPHQLRHGVGTALNAAGVPIADAARHLGHSKAVYVATYLHPSGADVGAVLASLLG